MRNLGSVVQRWEVVVLLLASTALQIFAYYVRVLFYLDVPLILVLYVGWYSAPARGAAIGTVFGLIQDAFYGPYLGLKGLSKTLIGFGAGFLSKVFRLDDLLSRCALISLVSLLDSAVCFLMLLLLECPISQGFWFDSLIRAVVTGVAGGIGSRFYDRFKFPRKDFRRVTA